MPHEYTRQRQGRDFSLHDYLMKNATKNNKNIEMNRRKGEDKLI